MEQMKREKVDRQAENMAQGRNVDIDFDVLL